jgi:hypothetical protein
MEFIIPRCANDFPEEGIYSMNRHLIQEAKLLCTEYRIRFYKLRDIFIFFVMAPRNLINIKKRLCEASRQSP